MKNVVSITEKQGKQILACRLDYDGEKEVLTE